MAERVIRAALVALAFVALSAGLWASVSPRAFYDNYPGLGHAWVAADGPYNEHLIRDFGALNLALAVVTIVAAVTLGRAVVIAAAVAWLAFQVPHLVYHVRHIDVFDTGDKVAVVVGLVAAVVLPIVILVAESRRTAPT
ncbi:MAG TPA: hypothetical protein VH479_09435 [Acidimicrobiales bacterium]